MDKPGEIEIIYVDSASSDGSPALAASFGARVIDVPPQRPTAALGRNAGWRAASAPFVLFLDGDTILHPGFVKGALNHFTAATSIIWGHRREIHPEYSLYNRALDLDWIYAPGITEFCGGDALVRRAALEDIGGFDETLIAGEEPEMCRRMRGRGWTILHIDHPMTGHDLAMNAWTQYWRRATRAGYAYAQISERYHDTDIPFWKKDAGRNRKLALFLMAFFAAGGFLSIAIFNPLPAVAVLVVFAAMALRTAVRARWKSQSFATLLLYGVHSHLQQIPIFFGQRQYRSDRRAGRIRGVIEYKGVQP
jgi:cellulose synthase/poly-beta-1,6-N-acetylglucosamine synthase-like glycosyltransferase